MDLLHANCVARDGQGLLITGPSGSGKSDISLRLIEAGWTLVGDDYCHVWEQENRLWAKPHENTKGKIEVRGVGIIEKPFLEKVEVIGIIDLAASPTEVDRLPDITIKKQGNINLSCFKVYPFEQSALIKVNLLVNHMLENNNG